MRSTTLIIPGYRGSGPAHWQSWWQEQDPAAERVAGVHWECAVLSAWAVAVRNAIDRAPGSVWLVAHSFGCLAALVAAADRADRVAGALLVAPADPVRVAPAGFRSAASLKHVDSVEALLPCGCLPVASMVVASSNDPYLPLAKAESWAERWGSAFLCIGAAGHINANSGFGPWPQGLELLRQLQMVQDGAPLGNMQNAGPVPRRRERTLARLRRATRSALELV